jgi:hypothetical protein
MTPRLAGALRSSGALRAFSQISGKQRSDFEFFGLRTDNIPFSHSRRYSVRVSAVYVIPGLAASSCSGGCGTRGFKAGPREFAGSEDASIIKASRFLLDRDENCCGQRLSSGIFHPAPRRLPRVRCESDERFLRRPADVFPTCDCVGRDES